MRLALQLSTYHSARFLPSLFDSLSAQTDRYWTLRIRDDGSSESELLEMQRILAQYAGRFSWTFETGENLGFAGSHQTMFTQGSEELVLLVNHDVVFTPTYIETLRAYMASHEKVGAAEGIILRAELRPDGVIEKTDVIDSLGLFRRRSHWVIDIGAGKRQTEYTHIPQNPIFGVSGCLPMYRRSAVGPRVFDPAFVMYKEDVDVAYRLQRTGWTSAFVPMAVAYHIRGFQASLLHRGVSVRFQELSYRNHWRNLVTHLTLRDWLRDGWAIVPFECAKAAFLAATHPMILVRTFRAMFTKTI